MATSVHSFRKLATVQFKLFAREPLAFFFTLVFPLLLLLLFGAIWGNEPGSSNFSSQYGYIDAQVPALAALIIGTVAMMSIPVATATAREQHLLRRFRATPLRSSVYLAADVAVYFLVALAGMAVLIAVATVVFDLRFGGDWGALLLGFTLSALAFIAVGYLIAGLAPTARSAQVVGQVIFFPMMFLSGAAMPLAIMPDTIQQVSQWLPLTYVVRQLQSLWFGTGWDMTAVVVLIVMLAVGTALSVRVFRWD
ncbi:MAG: ABC transporter permease [Caldilineales bacterium]|nr:ABC transporter permease [Caldilineales bacterium]